MISNQELMLLNGYFYFVYQKAWAKIGMDVFESKEVPLWLLIPEMASLP